MKKILALVLLMLSATATADTFECDAVSQLNRPAPYGPRSVLPVTFEFSKYGAFEQDSNNGSETALLIKSKVGWSLPNPPGGLS